MLDETIKEHILACYPEEACGLVLLDGIFIPCENIHPEPTKNFRIDGAILAKYIGKIKYIIHSHCRKITEPERFDLRTPSFSDIIGQKQSGIPWLIYGTEGYGVTPDPIELPRVKTNVYLQRPFIWFINDCYSLVQDYYLFELGVVLEDHKADKDFKDIRKFDGLFNEYIKEYGFIEYHPEGHKYQKGDLILLDTHGFRENHLGIYEDGYIIHQDLLSKKEPLEVFIGRINKVLRHESQDC